MQTFEEPYQPSDASMAKISCLRPDMSYNLSGGTKQQINWTVVRILPTTDSYIAINPSNDLLYSGVGTFLTAGTVEYFRLDRNDYVKCISGSINVTVMI
jgi:hypothetical protein